MAPASTSHPLTRRTRLKGKEYTEVGMETDEEGPKFEMPAPAHIMSVVRTGNGTWCKFLSNTNGGI